MFASFKMPDFSSRPDGQSKSLRDAYIALRRLGFPDKDIFIYPQGEFAKYRGDILDQRPNPGELVSPKDTITLIAAVAGFCELMPDLFTDHSEDFFEEEFNARTGARRLFAVFDSAILKLLCRLEWIRDIYAGIYHSDDFIDYLGALLTVPAAEGGRLDRRRLGFILPRLSRFLGTEGALKVFIESAIGIKADVRIGLPQRFPLPIESVSQLGSHNRLGDEWYLGTRFKAGKPDLSIFLELSNPEIVPGLIPESENWRKLEEILRLALPFYIERFEVTVRPDIDTIRFRTDESYLGLSTVLSDDQDERS